MRECEREMWERERGERDEGERDEGERGKRDEGERVRGERDYCISNLIEILWCSKCMYLCKKIRTC